MVRHCHGRRRFGPCARCIVFHQSVSFPRSCLECARGPPRFNRQCQQTKPGWTGALRKPCIKRAMSRRNPAGPAMLGELPAWDAGRHVMRISGQIKSENGENRRTHHCGDRSGSRTNGARRAPFVVPCRHTGLYRVSARRFGASITLVSPDPGGGRMGWPAGP